MVVVVVVELGAASCAGVVIVLSGFAGAAGFFVGPRVWRLAASGQRPAASGQVAQVFQE